MANTAYAEVLAWLYGLEAARGMDFKLERVALALQNLGDPQRSFASVHIAGTNGKGSVAAMLHSVCTAAGYRVGLYTSPHLVSFTERIRVGAEEIAADEVVNLVRDIRAAATVHGIDLTFFELTTVMAFLHFARCRVDLAVVEVGLGGRLDATNVLDPAVAVITNIGLDHTEFLGDTLASVAREKAGIIKPGRPVVVGTVRDDACEIVRAAAAAQGARAYWLGRDYVLSGDVPSRFVGIGREVGELTVPLRGGYQRENAATAIAAALLLGEKFPLSERAVRCGLARARWPGRLDVVQETPLVLLDGAHNVDGIAALARELPAILGSRRVHLLFAVMRDKLWQPMADILGPVVSTATLTTALGGRGEAPERLARAFEAYCPVCVHAQPVAALEALLHAAHDDDAVLVTGSLFLVGAIYPYFLARSGRASLFGTQAAALQP
jgi:dihydrofolate synthase/folylpolyglutamate synthase